MSQLTVAQIASHLEAQIAFHREQEAFHGAQEVHHREQRGFHAAELESLSRALEALRAAETRVADVATRSAAPPSPPAEPAPDPDAGRLMTLPRMIARVLEAKPRDERFGASAVVAEVNRRYPGLRKRVRSREVSIALRRMRDTGQLREVQPGRPRHEALYSQD